MRTTLPWPRHAALVAGTAGAILVLALTARPSVAEKAVADDCANHTSSVCRLVETCSPKGFEDNGTCKWIYTASRSYWKF
jgi:hypothetical protein